VENSLPGQVFVENKAVAEKVAAKTAPKWAKNEAFLRKNWYFLSENQHF
jgi:hypothetical protein